MNPASPRDPQAGAHAILLREKPEPSESRSQLPLTLIGLMSTCILFAAFYLGRYSGGFDPMVYDERILPGMLDGAAPPAAIDPAVAGRRLFAANCIACHQTTGLGIPGTYPPLAGSEWVAGSEERLVRIVLHGISGPITVKGAQFNNTMPAFAAVLKDEQIAHVLTYVRSEWGNKAPAVAADKAKSVRALVADRTAPWSPEELLKLP